MNFNTRSAQKEILDQDNIPFDDIRQNMKELNVINTYLGGHRITIKGFSELSKGRQNVSICEMGCGGGDNLAAIDTYATHKNIQLQLIGIDIKEECIQYAKSCKRLPASATLINSDYAQVKFQTKPDIIFSSLFCHHFTDEALVAQLKWMRDNSTVGFFINDLQRNPVAYHSIGLLTKMFSSSYLVKNDAPISVLRGFHKNELQAICDAAGIRPVQLQWQWAFRYLLMYKHA